MLATGLFLIASPKFALLMLCWLLGVALVVGVFLYNRRRIHSDDQHM